MPLPTPDPVNESLASGAGHLGWADFATIIGVVIAFLTFLGTLIVKGKKGKAEVVEDEESSVDVNQLKAKIKALQKLAEELDENYTELKKEIGELEGNLDYLDKTTVKDIAKLEKEIDILKAKMDKIIDLILKLLSDQQ